MTNHYRTLRHETLESRQMLSAVNVNIDGNTIEVTSEGVHNDDVEIRRKSGDRLQIKDHGQVIETIDLDQFDKHWNLYVDLQGGDDELRIKDIRRGLYELEVYTGGYLGIESSDTDNDYVYLKNIKAKHVYVDTGGTVGELDEWVYDWNGTYEDNDKVKLKKVQSRSIDIETGVEVHLGVMPYGEPLAKAKEINGDYELSNQLEDNDDVYVHQSVARHGDIIIDTGAYIEAAIWHDNTCLDVSESKSEVNGDYGSEFFASLYDDDSVEMKYSCAIDGCIQIDTGAEVDIHGAKDDFIKTYSDEWQSDDWQEIGVSGSDQDSVYLYSVFTRGGKHGGDKHDEKGWREEKEECEFCEPGSIRINTGARLSNGDEYFYLNADTNDDDYVQLKRVEVGTSLYIATGVKYGELVGDPQQSSSDRDEVILRYLKQRDRHASTEVYLGADDDELRIHRATFYGFAKFNGGDGHNTERTSRTRFKDGYKFINFDD